MVISCLATWNMYNHKRGVHDVYTVYIHERGVRVQCIIMKERYVYCLCSHTEFATQTILIQSCIYIVLTSIGHCVEWCRLHARVFLVALDTCWPLHVASARTVVCSTPK